MSRLTDLIHTVKQLDPQLGTDLEAEIAPLQERLPFGLNFEKHQPEAVELPGVALRVGSKVRVLPARDGVDTADRRLWVVEDLHRDTVGARRARISLVRNPKEAVDDVLVEDLVLVAEFRDPIYPGLRSTGTVLRGGDRPFHSVINGENFHVLEALTFTHRGRVDAIYIDPPYNTGARDWKYNNDYVESDDLYRHSKWLAFMERRLHVARALLNPLDSVLIVTIDEKEYLRLGLLLEQVFPDARIQMISTQINLANVARKGAFGRNDEYVFFVMLGDAAPQRVELGSDWVSAKGRTFTGSVRWDLLRRSGTNASRTDRPNLFYPIYINPEKNAVVSAGAAPTPEEDHTLVEVPAGQKVIWPIRKDGSHGNWQLGQNALLRHVEQGRVRLGGSANKGYVVYYIKGGEYEKIERGDYPIVGRNPDGSLNLGSSENIVNLAVPGTQWRVSGHDATQYGSRLLNSFLPGRTFPFPKALYAVEDALRFFVSSKPEAVVLDFFAGSGTTAHAVMRLNKQDGGRRQSISVTNNEVGVDEQRRLRLQGLRAGDAEWERRGICDYVTKPRIKAAITGLTATGEPISGTYKFVDEFPMSDGFEENAEFFTLTYESVWRVSQNRAFAAIAPLLWLRAGARGRRIDDLSAGWEVAEAYGILDDLDKAAEFIEAVEKRPDLHIVYIITDDDRRYQMVSDGLRHLSTVRLYSSYLQDFQINNGVTI
ncbi:DNA methyltransferase [Frigoribacterium sp. Leaf263]|nr:DNA methyltransferase [Frigoribacterium sp. Leaf263]